MEVVHFAFRRDGVMWSGGHTTYAVRASEDALTVSPSQGTVIAQGATFRAAMITRDGAELAGRGTIASADEGAIAIDRSSRITERWKNGEDGVEQSWTFASAPAGGGDLIVASAVSGEDFIGTTDGGLHFQDATTGLGVRYGRATWIDAAGVRTPIAPQWIGGAATIAVPADLIARSTFPAVLDPTIGPEVGMDAPLYGPASGAQQKPSVAWDVNHSMFLAAWEDQRAGATFDIYGARLNANGLSIDGPGLAISTAAGNQNHPDVAWDGVSFVVVWSDDRGGVGTPDIYATRVDFTGAILDPTGFVVSAGPGAQTVPTVAGASFAATPGTSLVAWQDNRTGSNNVYIRFVSGGAGLAPEGPISAVVSHKVTPDVAAIDTRFCVVWDDDRSGNHDIYQRQLTVGGAFITADTAVTTAATDQIQPAVTNVGLGQFYSVWADGAAGAHDIHGRIINPDTTVGTERVISNAAGDQVNPVVTGNIVSTNKAFAAWTDFRAAPPAVYGSRLDGLGVAMDPAGIAIAAGPTPNTDPAVAFNNVDFVVAWGMRGAAGPTDIGANKVLYATGLLAAPGAAVISTQVNQQQNASVTYGGGHFLVVWQDDRSGAGNDIIGARVQSDGTILDPTGATLCNAAGNQTNPAATFDGTNYVVVWEDYRVGTPDIYGQNLSPGGVLIGANFVVENGVWNETEPAIASSGASTLVTWTDNRVGPYDVYGAKLPIPGGVPTLSNIAVGVVLGSNQLSSAVAWDGVNYVAAWRDDRVGDFEIMGSRVSNAGAVLDPGGIPINTATPSTRPAISRIGAAGNSLVVWSDLRTGASYDVYGARMNAAGTVLEPAGIALATGAGDQTAPTAAYDGTDAFVIWQNPAASIDLYGGRVSAGGTALDGAGIPIALDPSNELKPSLASDGAGHLLVAYHRYDTAPTLGGLRVHARTITDLPAGVGCTNGNDCASGFCADGVCCNSACGGSDPTDCQACTVAAGGTMNGTCTPLATGAICRASTGGCDPAETCNGVATTCPADALAPNGFTCRAAVDLCDVAETCDGLTAACPSDDVANTATLCRTGPNACDADTFCDGVNTDCPPTGGVKPPTAVCRPATDVCDVAETCDGSSNLCPPDGVRPLNTLECRPPVGACDFAEACDGVNKACPPDGFDPAGQLCGVTAGFCGLDSFCTGTSPICPPNPVMPAGTTCRVSAGLCDPAETCDGVSQICPADAILAAGTVCRPAAPMHPCDVDDICDGVSPQCPFLFAPAGTICQASLGVCDVADTCDGVDANCASVVVAAGTLCRASTGPCDSAETCTGFGAFCPPDFWQPDGTSCSDGLTCDGTEMCMTGMCVTTALSCDDGNACTADMCSEPGGCAHSAIGGCCNVAADCADADFCTADSCSGPGGTCSHVGISGCCHTNADCSDLSACTTDTCDPTAHTCSHAPIAGCCSSAADCGDGNACTTDACDTATGLCSNTAIAGCCLTNGDCSDGDSCTTDTCATPGGTCTFPKIPGCCHADPDCDDGDACTTDACNTTTDSCTHTAIAGCNVDAGVPDAMPAMPDATPAAPDAAISATPDAGAGLDAGTGEHSGGCGCSVGARHEAHGGWILLLFFSLISVPMFRRR
jgi:hypothetical protein